MKFKFSASGWSVRITWKGIDLEPIARQETRGVSGKLRRVVTGWLTNSF